MSSFFESALYQFPVAGLMLVVVFWFLRELKASRIEWLNTVEKINLGWAEKMQKRDDQFLNALSAEQERNRDMQREAYAALKDSAVIEAQTVSVLRDIQSRLDSDRVREQIRMSEQRDSADHRG